MCFIQLYIQRSEQNTWIILIFQITNPNIKYQTHKWKFPPPENSFRWSACVNQEQRHPLTCTIWVTSTLNICLHDLSEKNIYTVAELPFKEHSSLAFVCCFHLPLSFPWVVEQNLTSWHRIRCLFISPLYPRYLPLWFLPYPLKYLLNGLTLTKDNFVVKCQSLQP